MVEKEVLKVLYALRTNIAARIEADQKLCEAVDEVFAEIGPVEDGLVGDIHEQSFLGLKYEMQRGERLGDFEVCYRTHNNVDEWQRCFNILKNNGATIKKQFSQESWRYHYWLWPEKYDDRIFRKRKVAK